MPPGQFSYESQQLPGGGGTKGKKEKITQLEAAQKSDIVDNQSHQSEGRIRERGSKEK